MGLDASEVTALFAAVVGPAHVRPGDDAPEEVRGDESLTVAGQVPLAVVSPATAEEVAAVLRVADEHRIPVTARGAGTGLSGGCVPQADGIVVAFDRMRAVLEVDADNFVAVVEPGVRLDELDAVLAEHGLLYPVFPGEYSASLGGNVSTNAGGMRAVKYGVTRNNVLGLEFALPSGALLTSGGKVTKVSSGYDLTQLVIGSEGTLAVVTKAWLRLVPRLTHTATLLAPFATLDEVTAAVPKVLASGIGPVVLEYIDMLTMAAATAYVGLDLGIPSEVKDNALAYLVVGLESTHADRLDADTEATGELLGALGAMDMYVLPGASAASLIDAREKAFWVAKANGADDIVDVVVPRGSIPAFMARVAELAAEHSSFVAGCGHAGDGNVHLGIFQPDPAVRSALLRGLFAAGVELGGAISGEHGLGRAKAPYFRELADPAHLELLARIKDAFDPHGILNPGLVATPLP